MYSATKKGIRFVFLFGADGRGRTGTIVTPRDFKSLASAYSATSAKYMRKTVLALRYFGGTTQIRTGGGAFAELCLTTWLWCQLLTYCIKDGEKNQQFCVNFSLFVYGRLRRFMTVCKYLKRYVFQYDFYLQNIVFFVMIIVLKTWRFGNDRY